MTSVESMKNSFYASLKLVLEKKSQNSQLFSKDRYCELISQIKECKLNTRSKVPQDYHRMKKYDILCVDGVVRLIVPAKENQPTKFYVCVEELFDIIHTTHISIGHFGRTKMVNELHKLYQNITAEVVSLYLSLCDFCKNKSKITKKCEIRPLLYEDLSSRCQVDVIDMQAQPDGDFKFICVYQDYQTQFTLLRALQTNQEKEVANVLLDIFTTFGAPRILQSANGREFSKNLVEQACSMWEDLKIVHGNLKLRQKERSGKPFTKDIEKLLSVWLQANPLKRWSEGLRSVQFVKNNGQAGNLIKRTPHEAMFKSPITFGLKTNLSYSSFPNIQTEEDLLKLIQAQQSEELTLIQTQRSEELTLMQTQQNKEKSLDYFNTATESVFKTELDIVEHAVEFPSQSDFNSPTSPHLVMIKTEIDVDGEKKFKMKIEKDAEIANYMCLADGMVKLEKDQELGAASETQTENQKETQTDENCSFNKLGSKRRKKN